MDYKANLIECINGLSSVYENRELELMSICELTRLLNELTYEKI